MRYSAAASAGVVGVGAMAQAVLRKCSLTGSETERITVASADLSAQYAALIDADDQGDALELARIGWELFAIASTAEQAYDETIGLLEELRLAARVAAAGEGSPASLALLREVLAMHGWLPPPGASPLQVLAAPVK